ncbi:hypothetical protein [Sporosarcina ureae]|uniref:hypothetical protein n=1 Tax=Sporosarcina ureae TaxID=1571 RepID=UPI0028AD2A3B|nr:hypothetical protein [Sporosarcina ureae]
MNKLYFKSFMTYFLMFPSIFIGILAMISYGVTPSIWIQNILIWLLGTVLGFIYLVRSNRDNSSKGNSFHTIVMLALLVFPLLFNGIDDVQRWLPIGPINIYIASIILPLLIIHVWKLAINHHELHVIGITFFALVILLFQPDAGQVTAFACALVIILCKNIGNRSLKSIMLIFITAVVIISWVYLDDLAAVPYVEHIIFLVADMGKAWFILGILSLILLLFPFLFSSNATSGSLSLGIYFFMMMIVTFFGHFPMPVMGYGISPVIGYLIAITWVNKMSR